MNISGVYNSDVLVWDVYGRALVELNSYCVIGCPLDGNTASMGACAERRSAAFRMREETLQRETVLSFGELSSWANRRAGQWDPMVCERKPDWQRVLGELINRYWVREALQWLYEQRTPAQAPVTLGLLDAVARCGRSGSLIVMRCGEWEAAVMCALGVQQGDDPLGEVAA
jgi:hypothetical protein